MALCASCGSQLPEDQWICGHHVFALGDDWAAGNRIMCGFFHRKEVPVRLAAADRDESFWPNDGGE